MSKKCIQFCVHDLVTMVTSLPDNQQIRSSALHSRGTAQPIKQLRLGVTQKPTGLETRNKHMKHNMPGIQYALHCVYVYVRAFVRAREYTPVQRCYSVC